MKKTRKARMPRPPDVAARVGNNPEPEAKETFQNLVLFITTGRYIDQASANLFGPRPKTGFSASTPLVTDIVALREGLTSVLAIERRLGIKSPIKPADIKKRSDKMATTKVTKGKCFFSPPSSNLSANGLTPSSLLLCKIREIL